MRTKPKPKKRPSPAWAGLPAAEASRQTGERTPELLEALKPKVNGNGSPCIQPGHRKGQKPPNAGKTYPRETLSQAEIGALIEANPLDVILPDGRTQRHPHWRSNARNRALIKTLARTGMRVGESIQLLPHHVSFEERMITVLYAKGRKQRVVGIGLDALADLSQWMWVRNALELGPTHPLFCSVLPPATGGPLGAAYIREMLKEAAARAGIHRRVHPHMLRHTFAAEWDRQGGSLRLLQLQLGHASLASTQTYLSSISNPEAAAAAAAFDWSKAR